MATIRFSGGINENDGADIEECQSGQNFELQYRSTDFRPRPPMDLKGTSTLEGAIAGILQLIKRDDTETTLIFDDDAATPTLYLWDGADDFTSKRTANLTTGSKLRDVYWSLDDIIAIHDISLLTPLLKWDGTACARLKTNLFAGSPVTVGTNVTSSGTTATVNHGSAHNRSTGDLVEMADAVQTEYNGEYEITVTGDNTFTYTFAGSATSPATGTITFDRGLDVFAKYALVAHGRLWLFNIKTYDGSTTDLYPHMVLVAAFEDVEDFDIAARGTGQDPTSTFTNGTEAFYLLTKDLKPINGVEVFNSQILISTKEGRLYRLTGTDAEDFNFIDYYAGSSAVGTEAIANIGNDVVYVKSGGVVETLLATDSSGDVSADDVSRWVPSLFKNVSDAKIIYDQTNQKVYFFIGTSVMVLFKNHYYDPQGQLSPWSQYKTDVATNGFTTKAARYLRRPGESSWSVYWGDDAGNIYDLDGSGTGDNGTDIVTIRKSRVVEELDFMADIVVGQIQYRRQGECDIAITFDWGDAYNETTSNITLKGPPSGDVGAFFGGGIYFGGDVYFNQGFQFADKVSTRNFSPTGRGTTFTIQMTLSTTVRFKIDKIEI
jgi:hypothetical protein